MNVIERVVDGTRQGHEYILRPSEPCDWNGSCAIIKGCPLRTCHVHTWREQVKRSSLYYHATNAEAVLEIEDFVAFRVGDVANEVLRWLARLHAYERDGGRSELERALHWEPSDV